MFPVATLGYPLHVTWTCVKSTLENILKGESLPTLVEQPLTQSSQLLPGSRNVPTLQMKD